MNVQIEFLRLAGAGDIPMPSYQTEGAAGLDLHAAVAGPVSIGAGESSLIPCGFCIAIPAGHEGQIRPRSGLAVKHGLAVLNSPGTVDSDYRGEIKVVLINHGDKPFVVERGSRIAQLVICPVARATLHPVDELPGTRRGDAGFGHTGT